MRESNCCGAKVEDDSDICGCCHEHCALVCELCGGDGYVDMIDESKINSRTIDVPYKNVICPECSGDGEVEAV